MNVSNFIQSAISELKQKALGVRDNVLRPVVDASKYITSPSFKTNLSDKLQKIKTLGERNAEWAMARVQDNVINNPQIQNTLNKVKQNTVSGINQVNSKLPFGMSIPASFSELNKRLEEAMGMTPEYKAVQDKIYLHGFKSLTKEERDIAIAPGMNMAMGMTTGIETKGAKVLQESGAVKNLLNKVTSKIEWSDPVEIQKLKNALSEGEGYLATNKDPLGKVLTPDKKAMIERSIESTKAKIAGVLKSMNGERTSVTGLLNESPAQTKMRRLANIKPQDVYQGTLDKIRTSEKVISQKVGAVTDKFDDFMKNENIPPSKKVNIFNTLSTPSRVLEKIGLKKEADAISTAWDNYQMQLPKEIERIKGWMQRVPEKGSEVRIFDYLDGKAKVNSLLPEEQKVAKEIKGYLKFWGDKLGIPEEGRISNYITHIFPKGAIEREFDPEIARAIDARVPSSVWNPFKQKRTNVEGYTRDVFQSLQAYTKRAVRQSFIEGPLKALSEASDKLDLESYHYVQKVTSQLNMRPTEVDSLIDNFIKSTPIGYKFGSRPWAYITHTLREATYKGTLGLNISSATRNISQLNNSYALLGERSFINGGIEFAKRLAKKDLSELYETGVLNNSFIEDKTLSVFKQNLQKVDEGLWSLFNFSEKLNRGISYFASKSKALNEGKTLEEAVNYAKNFVAKTQFKFTPLENPIIFGSDTGKLFGQFQSFNVKQGEFLVDLVKSKNFPAIARYIIGNLVFVSLIGKSFGMDWKDMIPFSGVATGQTKLGQTPAIQGVGALGNIASGLAFGNEEQIDKGKKDLGNSIVSFIPAGVQLKKTINGLMANANEGVYNPKGKLRFPVENKVQSALFGPNVSDTAKAYYDNPQPLSEKQTELYKALISSGITPQVAYDQITSGRGLEQKVQEAVKPDNGFNLFGFLKGKETSTPTEKTGIFKYLNQESQQTEQNKIISEVFANTSTPEEAQKALNKLLPGVTYQDAMVQSLNIENRSQYLYEDMSKLSDSEFGKSLQAFVENKVITNSVIDNWNETGKISDGKAKQLKDYIKLKTGKKVSGGRKPKKLSIGKIITSKAKLTLKIPKFKPVKLKYLKK